MTEETSQKETFKTAEGKQVSIEHNGTHFIAKCGSEIASKPWVKIESLKDELGIDYDKPKTKAEILTEKEERAIVEPDPKILEVQGTLKDGTKLKCVKKSTHWYAYNREGKQIGQPWILLNELCEDIGLKTELQLARTASADKGQPEHNHNDDALGNQPASQTSEEEEHPENGEGRNVRVGEKGSEGIGTGTDDMPADGESKEANTPEEAHEGEE